MQAVEHLPGGRRHPGRDRQLHPAGAGGGHLHPAPEADGARAARTDGVHPPVRRHALLPYYQRFFLGGETQIRGFNIRSVGPLGENNVALGGNKYALFNAEYYIDIGGPLRFLFFFDAGQAFLEGENIDVKKFRTSTGAELRFIMPVLNVPFRLIYAWNPNRDFFQRKVDVQVRRRHHLLAGEEPSRGGALRAAPQSNKRRRNGQDVVADCFPLSPCWRWAPCPPSPRTRPPPPRRARCAPTPASP